MAISSGQTPGDRDGAQWIERACILVVAACAWGVGRTALTALGGGNVIRGWEELQLLVQGLKVLSKLRELVMDREA